MSSPIAKSQKSAADRALIAAHQSLSHNHRISILADQFARRIAALDSKGATIELLDIGCGDMTLVDEVGSRMTCCKIQCADIHPCLPEVVETDPRWQRYKVFDGRNLPYEDGRFDVAILSDVLHHVPPEMRLDLLRSAMRVAKRVIIKDHFEYGWVSRQMLRAMDFVGNFGYGVSVPDRYFDPSGFDSMCKEAGMKIESMDVGLQLYAHLPIVRNVLSPKWHFFAVCGKAK